jgi:hypothetical protein
MSTDSETTTADAECVDELNVSGRWVDCRTQAAGHRGPHVHVTGTEVITWRPRTEEDDADAMAYVEWVSARRQLVAANRLLRAEIERRDQELKRTDERANDAD